MVNNWRKFWLITSVMMLLAFSGTAWAVKIEAVIGFGGLASAGTWTPINVTLENDSNKDFTGTLEAISEGYGAPGSSGPLTSCAPYVSLPSGSKKQYQIYVKLKEYGDTTVLLRSSYWIAAQVKPRVELASSGMPDYTVVTVGGRDQRLSFLANETFTAPSTKPYQGMMPGARGMSGMPGMPGMGKGPQITLRVGWTDQQNLPDRPAGYSSADMLVLLDFSVQAVSPEVLNAIKAWVVGGGTLVVPSGADYTKLQETSFYGELLPVTVTGSGQAPGMPGLESACKSSPIGPIALARATPIPDRCTYSKQDSFGLIWGVRNYGAGKVVFLAFDPSAQPFRNWSGQTAFWKYMVSQPELYNQSAVFSSFKGTSFMPGMGYGGPSASLHPSSAVSMNPAVETPSPNIIWIFLAVYIIVLVPVNYTVLRTKKRLELAWLTVPAIVLLFTIGAYGIGYSVKGGQILLSQASVMITSTGSRMAGSISSGWLFSPARRGYTVELNDPMALGNSTPSNSGGFNPHLDDNSPFPVVAMGEKLVWDDVKMPMWSSQSFESSSGLDLGGTLAGRVSISGTAVTGAVTNNTKYELKHCKFIYGMSSQDLGDISPGKTVRINISITVPSPAKGGMINPPQMPGMGTGMPGMGGGMPGLGMKGMPPGGLVQGMPSGQPAPANDVATRLRLNVESTIRGANEPLLVADIDVKPGYSIDGLSPKMQSANCIIVRF